MTPYLDFHTHAKGCEKYTSNHEVVVIQSLHISETPHPRADYVTIGIHPMLQGAKQILESYKEAPSKTIDHLLCIFSSSSTPVIGIGECGWDIRSELSLVDQSRLVEMQIIISRELRLPMIFHIVKAWHLLLSKRKQSHSVTPWIVHGFRGRHRLYSQLTDAGIAVSLHPLSASPFSGNFFLETDDTPTSIIKHYNDRGYDTETERCRLINLFYNTFGLTYR